jgi:hypothetical protein
MGCHILAEQETKWSGSGYLTYRLRRFGTVWTDGDRPVTRVPLRTFLGEHALLSIVVQVLSAGRASLPR